VGVAVPASTGGAFQFAAADRAAPAALSGRFRNDSGQHGQRAGHGDRARSSRVIFKFAAKWNRQPSRSARPCGRQAGRPDGPGSVEAVTVGVSASRAAYPVIRP
jgi:hypothetical protein